MPRKPNEKMKLFLLDIGTNYIVKDLVHIVNIEFNEHYKEQELRKYLFRNRIPYKYECVGRSHNQAKNYPIGTENYQKNNITIIKIANNKWVDKQRYIYEKHHKRKLNSDEFVIFMDNDKNNFNIDNLKVVSRKVAGTIGKCDLKSNDKDITELSLCLVELKLKTKDIEKEVHQCL